MISGEPFQWNGPQASEPVCDEKEYDELDSLFSKNKLLRGDLKVNASFSMLNIWKKKTKNKASFKPAKLQFPKQGILHQYSKYYCKGKVLFIDNFTS